MWRRKVSPRDVRHAHGGIVGVNDGADDRVQGGEGVVRDFGFGGAERGEQGGLPGIRETHEPGVRDGLQLEACAEGFTLVAGDELLGGLIGGALEVDVAPTATPATGKGQGFAMLQHLAEERAGIGVVNLRATRDVDHQVFAVAPVHLLPGAVDAVLREETRLEEDAQETIGMGAGTHDDVAAAPAIAAVGSAFRDVRLTAEASTSVASAPGAHLGGCRVYKGPRLHLYSEDRTIRLAVVTQPSQREA